MMKSLLRRILTTGAALCFSLLAACPAFAANLSGSLDSIKEGQITGWAWDEENPSEPVTVELTLKGDGGPGGHPTVSVTADQPRTDLKKTIGSSNHAFAYPIDWDTCEGNTITVTAEIVSGDTRTPIDGSLTFHREDQETDAQKTSYNKKESTKKSSRDANVVSEASVSGPEFGPGAAVPTSSKESKPGPAADESTVETGEKGDFLGEFSASGYCNCSSCSGGHNLTYSGTVPQPKHTIAADISVLPIGTKVMIDDVVYTVEDIGGGVKGNKLDIFFASHEEALNFGRKNVKVYEVK